MRDQHMLVHCDVRCALLCKACYQSKCCFSCMGQQARRRRFCTAQADAVPKFVWKISSSRWQTFKTCFKASGCDLSAPTEHLLLVRVSMVSVCFCVLSAVGFQELEFAQRSSAVLQGCCWTGCPVVLDCHQKAQAASSWLWGLVMRLYSCSEQHYVRLGLAAMSPHPRQCALDGEQLNSHRRKLLYGWDQVF